MAEIAEEEGVIEESESDIIKNMVKFKDVKIRNIMTPFSVMKIASESETIQNFYNKNTIIWKLIHVLRFLKMD